MSGSARGVTGQGFREIITRAVYGRGEGVAHGVVTFPNVGEVKRVLGATATEFRLGDISLRCSGEEVTVLANGQFDVHVWYICGEDTAVSKQAVSATVEIPVTPFGREQLKEHDVRVAVVKQPQCRRVTVKESEGGLEVEVTAMLKAEVVGETKLRVVLPAADGEPGIPAMSAPDPGHEPPDGAGHTQ
ncbi:MAG: outer spore coat protein CotE [Bacillota bacterium]